jgi:XTP/dITP diphosphohydrolase
MRIVLATSNQGKLKELKAILPSSFEVLTLHDISFTSDIEETATTLEGNALLKASVVWKYLLHHSEFNIDAVIADDSGLEVDVLNGAPGVYSARYAGTPKNDNANTKKLLAELKEKPNRKAQFRTVLAFINSAEQTYCEGIIEGKIALEEKGSGGFGYDPVFIPNGYAQTFAEMESALKNKISHRALALQELMKLVLKG